MEKVKIIELSVKHPAHVHGFKYNVEMWIDDYYTGICRLCKDLQEVGDYISDYYSKSGTFRSFTN